MLVRFQLNWWLRFSDLNCLFLNFFIPPFGFGLFTPSPTFPTGIAIKKSDAVSFQTIKNC